MKVETPKILRPDSKHRVTLGQLADGVSGYEVHLKDAGVIELVPRVEVPMREAWLWKNRKAAASVERGLEQAARGEVHKLGSFAKHADDK